MTTPTTINVRRASRRLALQVLLLVFAAVSVAPVLIIISTALKTSTELALNPIGLPQDWLFSNFAEAWTEAGIGRYVLNSITVAIPALVITIAVSSLAGYAFGVLRFRLQNAIFAVILIGLMLPAVSIVTSLSFVEQSLGLYNTLPGLVLAECALAIPLATFIMRSSFRDLPSELRDAVFVDGGNEFTAFLRVMLPLARPAVSAVAVLTFLTVWNDYLLPLVLINTESLRTVPLGLAFLRSTYVSNVVLIAASTTLAALPSIAIYLLLQRQFINGITQGSIK